jgi:hypothetical protein
VIEGDVLICGRFKSWDDPRVPNSEIRQCIVCAHDLWVSPDGLSYEDLPRVCLDCAIEMSEGDEEVLPLPGEAEKYLYLAPLIRRLIRERKGDT